MNMNPSIYENALDYLHTIYKNPSRYKISAMADIITNVFYPLSLYGSIFHVNLHGNAQKFVVEFLYWANDKPYNVRITREYFYVNGKRSTFEKLHEIAKKGGEL